MDGKSLLYNLRQALGEPSDSAWLDDRSSYTYLWRAATEFVARTNLLQSTQAITTTASTTTYNLNADFIKLYLVDSNGKHYVKWNDGTNDTFIYPDEYDDIIHGNRTDTVSVPDKWAIKNGTPVANVTGTSNASSTGSTLAVAASTFTNVQAGDTIHNTTDDAWGTVTAVASTTSLTAPLFSNTTGASVDWATSKAFTIVPQSRLAIVFDPPPSTSSHTVTVYYVQRPAPVFSSYGAYNIPSQYQEAIEKYAAWLYKYRDSQPNYGDSYYLLFDNAVRRAGVHLNKARDKGKTIKVSFK